MSNAEKFKQVFGIYATELWAMTEAEFFEWLNADYVKSKSMSDELNWGSRSDEWKAGWRAGQSGEDMGMPKEVLDSMSDEWKAGLIYAIKHPWGNCYVPMGKEQENGK